MKAVVFHGVGDIRLDDVPEPTLQEPTDAIIRITASAICGTDLHLVRGTEAGVEPGTILGHEAVGVVEQVGPEVTTVTPGDRVVVTSSLTLSAGERLIPLASSRRKSRSSQPSMPTRLLTNDNRGGSRSNSCRANNNEGVDVRALRKLTGMQGSSDKRAFDASLTDLQSTADIVISGISERLNEHGNKSGWNSTCLPKRFVFTALEQSVHPWPRWRLQSVYHRATRQ